MANEKELNPSPKFPVGEKPELSPNPNFSDGLENKTSEKANTQIVNESKPQPIKDLTVQQIIELIQKYAPGFDPSSVQVGELVSALGLDEDGLLKKQALAGLFDGKYVRIMDAPESTTLTDEEIEVIKEGVFIDGTFLNYHNPILFPFRDKGSFYSGVLIGESGTGADIRPYVIIKSSKLITFPSGTQRLGLGLKVDGSDAIVSIYGKQLPFNPANTGTFTLKCVDGVLTWVADAE